MNLYRSLSRNILKESDSNIPDDIYSYLTDTELTEAPNPENAEANELLRNCLQSMDYTLEHEKELKKLGITLDKQYYSENKSPDNLAGVTMVGSNGRKLNVKRTSYDQSDVSEHYPNDYSRHGDNTLGQKTYAKSKEEYKKALSELPKLKKRLKLYEKRYGVDHQYTKDLRWDIQSYENTINKGITPSTKERKNQWGDSRGYDNTIHPDADIKGYMDAVPAGERPKSSDSLVGANGKNKTVDKYNNMKAAKRYGDDIEKENKELDKRDEERLKEYKKDLERDKENRDIRLKNVRDTYTTYRDDFDKRLADFRKKKGIKDSEFKEGELPSATGLFDQIDAIVPAVLVEDEDALVIEVLDGTLTVTESDVEFKAPWLPVNNNPLKFTSATEFIMVLDVLSGLFNK